eukprot:7872333-Karenia_brevis.AAC.1
MHCIHSNNRKRGGKIPYVARFGRKWEGQEIPFGAGVWFMPPPTKMTPTKAAPPTIYGIII